MAWLRSEAYGAPDDHVCVVLLRHITELEERVNRRVE